MKNLLVLILLLSMLISCNKSDDIKETDIQVNNKTDNLLKNANGVHKLIPVEEQNKIRERSKTIAEAEQRDKILAEAEQKAKEDAKLKAEQKTKEDAKAKELNAELSIDKFKLKYSDLWKIEKETTSHIEMKSLSGTFNFEITKTPASDLIPFTSYLLSSNEDYDQISKKVSEKFTGYISEGKYLDGSMVKIVTMAIKDTGIIIISINSNPEKWYLNSEIFDLMLDSLEINQ
jgi:excinuclease UvrABC nuclease subunit